MPKLFSRIVPPDFTLEEGPPNFTGPWNKIAGPETLQRILDELAHITHECQVDHSYRILCSGNVVKVHDPLNPDGHWIDDGHGGPTLRPIDKE